MKGIQAHRLPHQGQAPLPLTGEGQVHPDDGEVVRMMGRHGQACSAAARKRDAVPAIEQDHGQDVMGHDAAWVQRHRPVGRVQALGRSGRVRAAAG